MLERPLRIAALVLSFLVIAGFGLFAVEDMGQASTESRDRVAGFQRPVPSANGESERERRHSKAREWVDDANDVLLRPFDGVVDSSDQWVARGIPALLALFVYGFLLAFMARYMRARA